MRVYPVQWRPVPNAIFCVICATAVALASQQVPPPARQDVSNTLVGYLVKAELRSGAQITFPAAPNQPQDVPHNAPVARNKGKTLLVLHFELRLTRCARLDREVLVVRENVANETQEGNVPGAKIYSYGGWWVQDAKYALCGRPAFAQPTVGPWINTFWDPLSIQPEMGQLDLIYEIDPASKNLVFTDGNVSIDVDALLKRH